MDTTDGKVWVSAPVGTAPPSTGGVQGVYIGPGQTVQWTWAHGPDGSYVSGYTIVSSLFNSEDLG